MTLPNSDTLVSYPAGDVVSSGTVLHVESLPDGRRLVLLDATACHPVDAAWPDQGADRGVLVAGGVEHEIVDCVVGATDGTALFLGSDVPVRKGTEGWAFVVAHVVSASADVAEGNAVEVRVDVDHRAAVSAGHTGCHLASLALNAALADSWSKDAPTDARGIPNFDQLAIETSTIVENGSIDVYRLGKSLRRKGFVPARLTDDPEGVEVEANALLARWVASGAAIRIERDGERLTDRRYWQCELPGDAVSIPCGGTHLGSLAGLSSITVALVLAPVDGGLELTMTTTVARPPT